MKVYLDHSATTYTDPAVLAEMLPYFTEKFGNASSQHTYGQEGAHAVDRAREQVAAAIGAQPNEIYFTSGGTESNNWTIKGIARAYKAKGNHIITSSIEHPAVLSTCETLEKEGFEVTYLPVDSDGIISLEELKQEIKDNTVLITIMACNNEIGSIQPISEIGMVAREKKIYFHTDAVQAMGTLDINVKDMNIDLLSISAHKFYGPKGIGALYIRNGIRPERVMSGGEQERKQRGGTYNTPGIVGLGKALEIAVKERDSRNAKIKELRDYFVARILAEVPYVRYNGSKDKRMSNNANFSFEFIEGESLLLNMDLEGISASSGSACSSGSLKGSHVLEAIGVDSTTAQGTIRFSLGKDNTKEEMDYTVEVIKKAVKKLRILSPLFNEIKGEPKYV